MSEPHRHCWHPFADAMGSVEGWDHYWCCFGGCGDVLAAERPMAVEENTHGPLDKPMLHLATARRCYAWERLCTHCGQGPCPKCKKVATNGGRVCGGCERGAMSDHPPTGARGRR